VSLPAYQQFLLNGIDRALEARDPGLASKFALFTRMTKDDGPPRRERLAPGQSLPHRLVQTLVRAAKASTTIPVVLVAGLMAAIIALGVITSRGAACPPSGETVHQLAQMRTAVCETSAHGAHK
jgi:hypothetical protein